MLLLLLACDARVPVDPDGDGFDSTEDCNNLDATVFPGAVEPCDGIDNDCDGEVDEATTDAPLAYRDADRDGEGDDTTAVATCTLAAGWSREGGDCNDADGTISPDLGESCNGVDDDCNGVVDDACHGAPNGEVGVDVADLTVLAPCDHSAARDTLAIGDVNGDALADLVALEPYCAEEPVIAAFLGPLDPVADFWGPDIAVPVELAPMIYGTSPSALRLDLGPDVDGDSIADLAVAAGTGSDNQPFRASLLPGPLDAALMPTVEVEFVEADDWTQLLDIDATLLAGEPGVLVVTLEANPVGDVSTAVVSYVADASAAGLLDVSSLGTLADNVDGAALLTATRRAGDLDGDGIADLARVLPSGIELFMGPIPPAQVGTPADGLLRARGDVGLLRTISCEPGDLDGDGTDDLAVGGLASDASEGGVFRTRSEGGAMAMDESPVLRLPEDAEWLLAMRLLDADGDGVLDVATGDAYYGPDRENWGRACLDYGPFEGRRVACDDGLVVAGDEEYDDLGRGLSAGDTNGDGFDDLLITGPWEGEADPIAFAFLGGP